MPEFRVIAKLSPFIWGRPLEVAQDRGLTMVYGWVGHPKGTNGFWMRRDSSMSLGAVLNEAYSKVQPNA